MLCWPFVHMEKLTPGRLLFCESFFSVTGCKTGLKLASHLYIETPLQTGFTVFTHQSCLHALSMQRQYVPAFTVFSCPVTGSQSNKLASISGTQTFNESADSHIQHVRV